MKNNFLMCYKSIAKAHIRIKLFVLYEFPTKNCVHFPHLKWRVRTSDHSIPIAISKLFT